jgi:L-asparaginase
VHGELQAALDAAQAAGVVVWRCTRCAEGHLVSANPAHAGPAAAMSPWQARTALLLSLLSQRCAATGGGG